MAESPLHSQSTIVSVRSKNLAKILRSYKDGKFIYQDDHTKCACKSTLGENLYKCGSLPARLARADLMLIDLEPKDQAYCPILADTRHPSSDPAFTTLQNVLRTKIKNLRLRKLLIKADFSQTLSHLHKFQETETEFKFPLLYQLDTFLESLRCVEQVPAGEIKAGGLIYQVSTEEFSEPRTAKKDEADFLIWVQRSDVDIEELCLALSGLHRDGLDDVEKEEKLAETVEALRRSGASEKTLRVKGAIKEVLNLLRV